jgi:CHAD domain-containing protein
MPVIYWRRWPGHAGNGHFSPIERNPTMNRRNGRVTTQLLSRRAAALKRHLGDATNGDAKGVHQSRVASRRLREALPVLTSGVKGTKAKKALGKIRRLTKALGTVRELDVTLELLDELTVRDTLPRPALEAVRAHVVNERERRRAVMLKRLAHVNVGKLEKRLADAAAVLAGSDSHEWRDALGSRLVRRAKALTSAIGEAGQLYAAEPLHQVRIAAKKLRYAMELAGDAGVKARGQAGAGHARPAARPAGAADARLDRAGHAGPVGVAAGRRAADRGPRARGRMPSPARPLRRGDAAADRGRTGDADGRRAAAGEGSTGSAAEDGAEGQGAARGGE